MLAIFWRKAGEWQRAPNKSKYSLRYYDLVNRSYVCDVSCYYHWWITLLSCTDSCVKSSWFLPLTAISVGAGSKKGTAITSTRANVRTTYAQWRGKGGIKRKTGTKITPCECGPLALLERSFNFSLILLVCTARLTAEKRTFSDSSRGRNGTWVSHFVELMSFRFRYSDMIGGVWIWRGVRGCAK